MSKKDYIQGIDGAERRFFVAPVGVEKREDAENDAVVIEGYAALFDSRTDLGWFEEEIHKGAFDDVLQDDVRCLYNHDPNRILARSNKGKGTLTLEVDSQGLKYRYTTPDRTYARDLADAIAKGDVSQSSFAFGIKEQTWVERDGEKSLRQIKKFERLYDVAPVTYPAYQDTSVAKRSFEAVSGDAPLKQVQGDGEGKREENSGASAIDVYDAQYMYNVNNS